MKPDELILRPKKSKIILLAFVSFMFTIGGIFIIKDEDVKGWLISIFFGLCFTVAIIQLIPGSPQLKLTTEGFIMTSLFRSHFIKWEDIKHFKEGYTGTKRSVVFDYVDSHNKFSIGKNIAKQLSDSHGALPDTYGLKTSELVRLMNKWKDNKYDA